MQKTASIFEIQGLIDLKTHLKMDDDDKKKREEENVKEKEMVIIREKR